MPKIPIEQLIFTLYTFKIVTKIRIIIIIRHLQVVKYRLQTLNIRSACRQ